MLRTTLSALGTLTAISAGLLGITGTALADTPPPVLPMPAALSDCPELDYGDTFFRSGPTACVALLQQYLHSWGYTFDRDGTGNYASQTQAAVLAFQQSFPPLNTTGNADPDTLNKINDEGDDAHDAGDMSDQSPLAEALREHRDNAQDEPAGGADGTDASGGGSGSGSGAPDADPDAGAVAGAAAGTDLNNNTADPDRTTTANSDNATENSNKGDPAPAAGTGDDGVPPAPRIGGDGDPLPDFLP